MKAPIFSGLLAAVTVIFAVQPAGDNTRDIKSYIPEVEKISIPNKYATEEIIHRIEFREKQTEALILEVATHQQDSLHEL